VWVVEECCCDERLSEMAEMHLCFSRTCIFCNCVINTDLPIFISLWIYLLNPFVLKWQDVSDLPCAFNIFLPSQKK